MNLCLYTPEQEENIFIRKRAQTWRRSGLLSKDQLQIIEERTATQLTKPSFFFRTLCFVFTSLCISSVVGLAAWILDADNEKSFGLIALSFSIPMYVLAEFVVRKNRFYRNGIEEALALHSMAFFCVGIITAVFHAPWDFHKNHVLFTFLVMNSAFAYWLYLRFGFLYAALISTAALCSIPITFSLSPLCWRMLLFLILGLLFLISLQTESNTLEDFRKKRKGILQACLFAGIYLSVNLRIFEAIEAWAGQHPPHLNAYAGFPPAAYWISYTLTFLVPVAGLYLGIKARKRALMNTAAIALVLTLATNKDYLGLKHYAWDPIILGTMLILAAILIIRWLARGRNKERNGLTADSILKPERDGLNLAEIGAAAVPGMTASPADAQPAEPSPFENGQSGGGGAARGF